MTHNTTWNEKFLKGSNAPTNVGVGVL
jgi:hypothetical protein